MRPLAQLLLAAFVTCSMAFESEWNQELRDYVLDIHNEYRRNEGGCQINKLEYDMELEAKARAWAERCVYEHQMKGFGENLAWDSEHRPEKWLIETSAKRWFDEKFIYDYGQFSCSQSCHYTQLVWHSTERMGCYSLRCPHLEKAYDDAWYIVCFYTPLGNEDGEKPFEKVCDTPCLKGQTLEDGLCKGKALGLCKDRHENCEMWAGGNQCEANPGWMLKNCRRSCKECLPDEGEEEEEEAAEEEVKDDPNCTDDSQGCEEWAEGGECEQLAEFMEANCRKSCGFC